MGTITARTFSIAFLMIVHQEAGDSAMRSECLRLAKDQVQNGVVVNAINIAKCVMYIDSALKELHIPKLHKVQRPGFYTATISLMLMMEKEEDITSKKCVQTMGRLFMLSNSFVPIKRRGKDEANNVYSPLSYEL